MKQTHKKSVIFITMLLSAALVVSAYLACSPGQMKLAFDKRPNLILISVDTLRADHLGCYGYQRETSPHMDELAREGARFVRALSPSPWTLPAHVTMFTGQETSVHNVRSSSNALDENAVTLTEMLHDSGYATFGIGSSPYLKGRFGYAQGFDVYDDKLGQISYKKSHYQVTAKKAVNKALKAIKQRRDKRWFVFIHFWDVHYDYIPPKPYDRMFAGDYDGDFPMHKWEGNKKFRVGMDEADFNYVISQYDGEIAWVDSQIGRLIKYLKKWELYDKTAIVITSDHGEEFLDHGQKGHGHTLFDELIRVPLIVKAPKVDPGLEIECPVSLVDLLPTFVEWGKVKKPSYRGPGRSLLDHILRRKPCDPRREFFSETRFSNLDKLHAYKRGFEIMLEIDRIKFHKRVTEPHRELLFNVAVDPLENNDLTANQTDLSEQMRDTLIRHGRRNEARRREVKLSKRKKLDPKTRRQLKELGYIQ